MQFRALYLIIFFTSNYVVEHKKSKRNLKKVSSFESIEFEIIQQWSPCENVLEEMEYYLNRIPQSRPSEVKVYNPTRLLLYKPVTLLFI